VLHAVLRLLQWHMPELDCPQGRNRHSKTLDERIEEGNVPLW
jgi:hypothetical protein